MTDDQLREYCDAEFENIDAVEVELRSIVRPEKSEYSIAELAAISTFIHNIYNGIENILKRVFRANQIKIDDTPTWHKDLLKTASDIEIIPNDLYVTLSDYLSFRHFFVHSYSFRLKWEELKPLVDGLGGMLNKFRSAINHYIEQHN
ncbi:MAG: hypothetical protein KKH68_10570 [Proteobacteria bacterium]|nr:hypothetical protein [Pseudomonadota bacterium]